VQSGVGEGGAFGNGRYMTGTTTCGYRSVWESYLSSAATDYNK